MHLNAQTMVGVPYTEDMIANADADFTAQANPDADTSGLLGRYPKAVTGDFDGDPKMLSEMDTHSSHTSRCSERSSTSREADETSGYR